MIAVIIDLIASRDVSAQQRRALNKKVKKLLYETYERFEKYCKARPSLTQGDSIEVLVASWLPIIYIFHRLLIENLQFRVGIGTGKMVILRENADDCDGPAFWNAREAIIDAKRIKHLRSNVGIRLAEKTSSKETCVVTNSLLFLAALQTLSPAQLRYCYNYLWEEKQIARIAERVKTTPGNVSKTLGKTPCYLLNEVLLLLSE